MSGPKTIFCSYCYNNFNATLRSRSVSLYVSALSDFFPMNIEVISQGANWVQRSVSFDLQGQCRHVWTGSGEGAMRASAPMIYLLLTDGYKEG